MNLHSLRTRIVLITALPALMMAGTFAWYLIQHHFLQHEEEHFKHLHLLTHSISSILNSQREQEISPDYNALSNALLSASQIKSVTFLDSSLNILHHQGTSISTRLKPDVFPDTTPKLFNLNGHSVFIVPLLDKSSLKAKPDKANQSPHPHGWIVIEAERKQLNLEIGEAIKQAIWSILITLVACLLAIRYLSNLIIRPITETTQALDKITENDSEVRVGKNSVPEISALGRGINTLAHQLTQIQSDMKQEIVQTTEDLRETLETIEIQNVELDIARKQAILANQTKSQFLANMSHEIRTPLNGILGFTKLLLKSPLKSRQQDHLQTIKKSSEILLLIINDILDFSKIEAGKLLLEKSAIAFHELIDDVVTMLAPTAHAKNLELVHLHYQDVPHEIMGDPLRIKQIVTNLINNAIKFTQSGQVVVRVMLADEQPSLTKEFVRISVSDTGVGLSRAQQHSIFNAFSQADASTARHYGGTGLGLSISKKLIEQMEGNIGFESELGKGSTFWFTLPIEIPKTTAQQNAPRSLKNYHILCFEPSYAPRLAIEHLLQAWQANYQFFDSIEQLIKHVKQTKLSLSVCHATLLCLDRNEVSLAEHSMIVKQLIHLGQKVVLVTPTLEEYEVDTIHLATAHLVKPLTQTRFYHVLSELSNNTKERNGVTKSLGRLEKIEHIKPALPILVVDDNDINLALVASILESLGIEADSANDGFEALEHCQRNPYALILMDIQMPGMDGIEAMKKIRLLNSHFENVPIVALTAYALPEERETFLSQGFQNLITKPVNEDKLTKLISRYLTDAGTDSAPDKTNVTPIDHITDIRCEAVDLAEGIRLSNGNVELATELMNKFLSNLKEERIRIERLHSENQLAELETVIHKLHGACHYCGVPHLRNATRVAEHILKVSEGDLSLQIQIVLVEIDRVIEWQNTGRPSQI